MHITPCDTVHPYDLISMNANKRNKQAPTGPCDSGYEPVLVNTTVHPSIILRYFPIIIIFLPNCFYFFLVSVN